MSTLQITRANASRLTEQLREKSPFGTTFTDHMFVARYREGRWVSAELTPFGDMPISPAASALHYGQAIFEGFKAHRRHDGRIAIFRPLANHARLNASAARLAMPEVPRDLFMEGLLELVRLEADWVPREDGGSLYVRPLYFADEEVILVRPSASYRFLILTSPAGPYFTGAVDILAESKYVRATPGGTGDAKAAGNYAGSLLAAKLAQEQGFHTVLWLDAIERRYIEECGVMNIMFVMDGTVVTPPLSGTILPGITRDTVLTLCRDLGIPVEERRIAIDELFERAAAGKRTEAAGIGTAATIAPIRRIRHGDREIAADEHAADSPFVRVRQALDAIKIGRAVDTHDWITVI